MCAYKYNIGMNMYTCVCMYIHIRENKYMYIMIHTYVYINTADPTWGDIFECCFKSQSSKLEHLFSLKRRKRDVRALSFELSKMSPQLGLAVRVGSVCGYD